MPTEVLTLLPAAASVMLASACMHAQQEPPALADSDGCAMTQRPSSSHPRVHRRARAPCPLLPLGASHSSPAAPTCVFTTAPTTSVSSCWSGKPSLCCSSCGDGTGGCV
jgi:hypothetical protein